MPALRRTAVSAATTAAVLGVLVGGWELYRWIWISAGWTWPFVVDNTSMPHIHTIVQALFRQPTAGVGDVLVVQLLHAALFTAKEAVVGFAMGASVGFVLGIVMSEWRVLQRGFLPYVVASQTVPILAIAPIVVVYLGSLQVAAWFSVAVIAANLTFFPVAINTLRGLQSTDRRAVELMCTRSQRIGGGSSGSSASPGRGWNMHGETCTQYLFIDYTFLERPDFEGAKYVYTPPPRAKENQDVLWNAVRTDVLSVISTDHCAFRWDGQKTLGRDNFSKIPNGGPGIENRLHMIHEFGARSGRITLNRMVERLATNPAKLFGLYPRKDDCRRLRRRHRRVRPRKAAHALGVNTPFEGRLQPLSREPR